MAELDPNFLIDISTKIASIDERTKAFEKNADHRHTNAMQAMQNFVPRREIDQMNDQTRAYAETLANTTRQHCDTNREIVVARVEKVEKGLDAIVEHGKWVRKTIIGAGVTAGLGILSAAGTYLLPLIKIIITGQ